MNQHEKMNYVEFAANNLEATKAFFSAAFGWTFQDYGDDYTAFLNEGLDGGFYKADKASSAEQGGALIVFFSDDLETTLNKVESAGGKITRPPFGFPGGRRFHFTEPSGNEFAVWSDVDASGNRLADH